MLEKVIYLQMVVTTIYFSAMRMNCINEKRKKNVVPIMQSMHVYHKSPYIQSVSSFNSDTISKIYFFALSSFQLNVANSIGYQHTFPNIFASHSRRIR